MAKKSLVFFLIVAAILAACGSPATPEPTATPTATATNMAVPTKTATSTKTATVTATATNMATATASPTPEPEFACGITASELAGYKPVGSFSEGYFAGEAGHSFDVKVVFTAHTVSREISDASGAIAKIDAVCGVTLDGEGNRKIVLVVVQAERLSVPDVNVYWAFTYSASLGFPVNMTEAMITPDKGIHPPAKIAGWLEGKTLTIGFVLDTTVGKKNPEIWWMKDKYFGENPGYEAEIKEVVDTLGVSIDNNEPPLLWLNSWSVQNRP